MIFPSPVYMTNDEIENDNNELGDNNFNEDKYNNNNDFNLILENQTEIKPYFFDIKEENEDDNFILERFKAPQDIKIHEKINENIITNANINTKATSKPLLGMKTKRPEERTTVGNEKNKKQGRKNKNTVEKGDHTKFKEDNVMRKIKSNLLDYIHNSLNNSFRNKNNQFLKLNSDINENLKKDYNMKLLNTKINELYENSPISSKYRKQKEENKEHNKNLINKIMYEFEDREQEVINRLDLTYKDLLNEFRNKYLEQFLEKIKKEEKGKNESEENIKEYIHIIRDLCMKYEKWFESKNGRNRKKKEEN